MTYTVPYSFVPGTKAKADEVNANFIDVIDKLEDTNTRIDSNDTSIATINSSIGDINTSITDINSIISNDINTSISSLTSTKADKTQLDGPWVSKYLKLFDAVNPGAASTVANYSLTSYLPTSNDIYQIIAKGTTHSGSSSGNYSPLHIYTDWGGSNLYSFCSVRARTNAVIDGVGTNIIVVKNKLSLYRNTSYTGTVTLELLAYRKMGG